jgi:hypothetical protein
MSVLEKKALAFEKLAALQNEAAIDEVLAYLEKLNDASKIDPYVLQHALSVLNDRSSVLDKLAK